jgi:biotin-dependent carboxylase-like uncharacterized protein
VSVPVLEVLAPGLLTTVQDARLRLTYGRYGVSPGGALDVPAARLANHLVGNPEEAALLEITLVGPRLRVLRPTVLALTGADLNARLDERPLTPGWSVFARAGALLEFGERRWGLRSYLALAGGITVPEVLGSRSTDLRGGFGGLGGRALRAGDVLSAPLLPDPFLHAGASAPLPPLSDQPVRLWPGPHGRRFTRRAHTLLYQARWQVSPTSDRMGLRLLGPPLPQRQPAEVPSLGLPTGAVQVPPDGQPIVLLADHQPTGGYPVIACVVQADLPRLAQLAPGESLRFAPASPAAPPQASPVPEIVRDELGWLLARWAGAFAPAEHLPGPRSYA